MSPLLFIRETTSICDILVTEQPLICVILSPGCRRPSSAAMPSEAIFRMKSGQLPRDEFRPPTILNPRLRWPFLLSVTGISEGLEEGEREGGRRE